jgi:hypothetical protein
MLRYLLGLAVGGGVLLTVVVLGLLARGLGPPALLEWSAVECVAPPGQTPSAFVQAVQQQAQWTTALDVSEPALVERLRAAFAAHAWVERVDDVQLERTRITVALTFRVPTLVVGERVVDAAGVVLPAEAPTAGVPMLAQAVSLPAPGAVAADPNVIAAAALAARLRADAGAFRPLVLERTPSGWMLWPARPEPGVLWGSAPGSEWPGEAPATDKLAALRKQWAQRPTHDPLAEHRTLDLR